MSEGIAAGGPTVAPPPTQNGAPAPVDAKGPPKPDVKPKASAAKPESTWSDADESELLARLKKSPYGKLKVNGKEVEVDSLKSLHMSALRGHGANRLVEETNKKEAEWKSKETELTHLKQALEAARRGDRKAAQALGLAADEEREQLQKQWDGMSPEERAVWQENADLRRRIEEREAKDAEELKTRELTEKKAKTEAVMKSAKALLPKVLAGIREDARDVDLPHVIAALEDIRASGLRLGTDLTDEQVAEHVAAFVSQRQQHGAVSHIERMSPAVAAPHFARIMKSLKPAELEAALGDEYAPTLRVFADAWLQYNKRARTKAQTQQQRSTTQPAAPTERAPLSRFRNI